MDYSHKIFGNSTLDRTRRLCYNIYMARKLELTLSDDEQIDKIANALSAKVRRKIIRLSTEGSYSVMEMAQFLNMPVSTVSFHLKMLREAGLIQIVPNPTKKGNEKIISQYISLLQFDFGLFHEQKVNLKTIDIPVGSFNDFHVEPPCALADSTGLFIGWDRPETFYSAKRFSAQLLSFTKGYVEYTVPAFDLDDKQIIELVFSLELCSECPIHNNTWKSDITFWLNGVELCTYHSMGDYGDRPGKNTPSFWPANASQYGMLKKIRVCRDGTYLDEDKVSDVTIDDCVPDGILFRLRIGIKEDAKYVGGVNLFGREFGDTDQNILLQIAYI